MQQVGAVRISRQQAHESDKVVSTTHRSPLPPGNIHYARFCCRLSRHQCHSTATKHKSMKNSIDYSRNGTRDLPACGAVSQTTAPLLTRHLTKVVTYNTLIL